MIDQDLSPELAPGAVRPLPPLEDDPVWGLVATVDAEPAPVDDIVYPR
jgi:hypothetical protein